jgi:hypothetical protein
VVSEFISLESDPLSAERKGSIDRTIKADKIEANAVIINNCHHFLRELMVKTK